MTLIFSLHYFLWYGALTSIFGYESVYARHYTKASPIQFGYLNLVLPLLTVIVTPLVCLLADRRRAHRSFFTISLLTAMFSLCLFALLPILINSNKWPSPGNGGHHNNTSYTIAEATKTTEPLRLLPWIYFCFTMLLCSLSMGVNNCLSDSFAVLQAEENGTSFGKVIVWGTFGWAVSAFSLAFLNQIHLLPRLVPGILLGTLLLTLDIIIVTFWPRHKDFKLDLLPIRAAQTLTGSTSPGHKDATDYMPLNESAKINLGTEMDRRNPNERRMRTKSPVEILAEEMSNEQEQVFAGPFDSNVRTIDSETKLSTSSQVSNSGQIENPYDSYRGNSSAAQEKQSYEVTTTATKTNSNQVNNNNNDRDKRRKQQVINKSCVASFRLQLVILGLILKRRKSLIRYLLLFIISGFFMSIHWNYFFLYLEQIYFNKFELISALSMVTQSLLGELPFFILSRKFIQFFGRSHTLSISLISIGIRFILYAFFLPNVNMYFIAIADTFQGPNYGLFYVVMTEVGLEYSFCDDETVDNLASMGEIDKRNLAQVNSVRLALRSTVQSLAFACYEGIGVGLGSLVGGFVVNHYGFEILWVCMAFGAIAVGLINIIFELTCCSSSGDEEEEETSGRREFIEAHKSNTLQRILSRPLPDPKPPAALSASKEPLAALKLKLVAMHKSYKGVKKK